jgi:hypothetical protein
MAPSSEFGMGQVMTLTGDGQPSVQRRLTRHFRAKDPMLLKILSLKVCCSLLVPDSWLILALQDPLCLPALAMRMVYKLVPSLLLVLCLTWHHMLSKHKFLLPK